MMEYKLVKNAAMKRILFMLFAVIMSTAVCHAAMSNSKVRKETRFLTDKMAYELNLNTAQYNDVYEINYDFISGVRYLMDDVLRGEEWAQAAAGVRMRKGKRVRPRSLSRALSLLTRTSACSSTANVQTQV
jgi:hypothetical protein